ncbi:MAG: TAXI family TRAP transporter solute-binding subunit [Veillonellaceae bacterium]|nr:TAXI family TRAP transporter solute-binding subunit [Veillonellaceae bacterium]
MKLNTWKRATLAAGLVTAMLIAGCGGNDGGAKQYLNIGTGGTAGTYYPLGGAMAEILNKNLPNMNATAQSTGASVANVNMLKDGSIDLALIQNDIAYYAANGTEMFAGKPVTNLRGVATLYPETIQLITLQATGIQSVSDLRGKRVAVGAAGSGTDANARQILETFGLTYDDIDVRYLSFGEAAGALKDGNVDAAFVTAGFPTAAVQDIAVTNPIALIPVTGAEQEDLLAKYPYYTAITIPGGTYNGVDTDTPSVSVRAMIAATDKLSPELGYDVTKTIYSHLDRLAAAHAVGKMITKESAQDGMSIEMNAGAAKFFDEK